MGDDTSQRHESVKARETTRRLPGPVWLLWLVSIALSILAAAFIVLIAASPTGLSGAGIDIYAAAFLVLAPVYATVGTVIASRTAGNRVGWVIATIGLLLSTENFSGAFSQFTNTSNGRWLPGSVWANWLSSWVWVPAVIGALGLLPILFPDGEAPSRRWRPVIWVICAVAGIGLVGFVFSPDAITASGAAAFQNPVAVAALAPATGLIHGLYVFAILLGVLTGAASLVVRYRRGNPDERHQVKWFAGAFALVALMVGVYAVVSGPLNVTPPAWVIASIITLGLAVVPIAVVVAVLKYRLYDIDIVISRALVYGALAAFITAVYVGIVVGVGSLVGSGGQPNLVLSIVATAIVAVAFQPVRERVQKVANRVVYGKRATPYEVLSQFSERVAESYAAADVLPRMAQVLADGTGAERAGVWLRSGLLLREAAAWPAESPAADTERLVDGLLPVMSGTDRAVEVRHQGELLGALTVAKRHGESLTPIEEKLLDDLAHQAGLVLKNVGLTDELMQRLEDLRASRQRLVAAQDQERRKLERNLHDGAQQNLVALKVKLGLAESLAEKDPDKARQLIGQLKGDADEALETLRDLARGIYPPLLADRGLVAALESQARKATVPVEVSSDGIGRYSQDVEAAVYFCVLEALQNVQKYAHASRVAVRVEAEQSTLRFEVEDDGMGFDVATTKRGSGLTNMSDRLDALGGSCELTSSPGSTRLIGSLPIIVEASVQPAMAAK